MSTPLDLIADWPVPAASAAVVGPSGVLAQHGDTAAEYRLASVTKPLVARAAQVAVEEGVVELDTSAGPPGSTVRHLLAHASGLAMHSNEVVAAPGTRRVYSNFGFTVLAETIEEDSGIDFGRYLSEAIFKPLGMGSSRLSDGASAAGYGAVSTVADLSIFAADLLIPGTVSPAMHVAATSVQFPGLSGVLRDSAFSGPTTGGWVSRFGPRSHRTGWGHRTRRARSAISVSRGRSSGWIQSLGSR